MTMWKKQGHDKHGYNITYSESACYIFLYVLYEGLILAPKITPLFSRYQLTFQPSNIKITLPAYICATK